MLVPALQVVTRDHCLAVIARLDAGERPPKEYGHGISYEVLHNGRRYPPKALLGMAATLANGRHVASEEFRSGEPPGQTNTRLRELGFELVRKRAPEGSTGGQRVLDPAALAFLAAAPAGDDDRPTAIVRAQLDRFRRRFDPERLRTIEPGALLQEMHERDGHNDSLVYWLEFKHDDEFHARWFGSILGGSAFKYGLYYSTEHGQWRTGTASSPVVLTTPQAVEVAVRQRAEILAAFDIVSSLPDDLDAPAWTTLGARIAAAAPEFGHLAFFHKLLALWEPERLDDYHSPAWQTHMLTSLGIMPAGDGLWANARLMVGALREWRAHRDEEVPFSSFTLFLNRLFGEPVRHWRIGTSIGETSLTDLFFGERCAAVGWDDLGDLDPLLHGVGDGQQEAVLKKALADTYPNDTPQWRGRFAAQLRRFARVIAEGDRVYAARGKEILAVGVVEGAYHWVTDGSIAPHRRPVRWLCTAPFRSPTNSGLLTTVHHIRSDFALIAAANLHLLREAARTAPAEGPTERAPERKLSPLAAQLERKGQVIVHGPPGTGKTFHALQVAEELVAERCFRRAWTELSAAQREGVSGRGAEADQRIWLCTFHPAYSYEDFVEGLRARPVPGGLDFRPTPGLFKVICTRAALPANRDQLFVLVVDEFNRGDAPRIFGELLTLLELDKRGRVHATLPLSQERFTVPPNVRLIATMNTADRSIGLLDAALRRRFGFVELMPDPTVLAGGAVEGLDLGALLVEINRRLLGALGTRARDLQVGHAYLMKDGERIGTVRHLRDAFRHDLLPLLQEYCAEAPDTLLRILGDELYERDAMRIRAEPFEPGAEAEFIQAVLRWAPERLAAADAPPEIEVDGDVDP
jgi:5-methylcytosine-specific restriction protein B